MIKKLIAFTLSEVLLVTGIIGVIGALTIPNMKKSYERKARIAKAKADFYNLDTALQQLDVQEVLIGKSSIEELSLALIRALAQNVKFNYVCGKNTEGNICFTSDYANSGMSTFLDANGSNCATGILKDNTEILLCGVNYVQGTLYGFIMIDVDGARKGAQNRGDDLFYFEFAGNTGGNGLKYTQSPEVDILN